MPISIGLNSGCSGKCSARTLISKSNSRCRYNLYQDANYTIIWGDGTSGTSPLIDVLILNPILKRNSKSYTVYAKIPAAQQISAGYYQDAIVVTVSY